MRRWHARREVLDAGRARWFAGQRDVRALLVDLLNVLLAADAAVGAERHTRVRRGGRWLLRSLPTFVATS